MSRRPALGAVLIAVGDEVLGGFTQDTNSHFLAATLREAGWPVLRIEVVGDVAEDIAESVLRAVADPRAARIVVGGGLGPTPDDLTLEAVAAALGRPLVEHPDALAHVSGIVSRMYAAGWVDTPEISDANRKMTLAPQGSTILVNRRGMASGIAVPLPPGSGDAERWLLALPGVPRELRTIVTEVALDRLFGGGVHRHVVELSYPHAIEADFTGPMEAMAELHPEVSVGSYPQTEPRRLVLRVSGERRDAVDAAAAWLVAQRPDAEVSVADAPTGAPGG